MYCTIEHLPHGKYQLIVYPDPLDLTQRIVHNFDSHALMTEHISTCLEEKIAK